MLDLTNRHHHSKVAQPVTQEDILVTWVITISIIPTDNSLLEHNINTLVVGMITGMIYAKLKGER